MKLAGIMFWSLFLGAPVLTFGQWKPSQERSLCRLGSLSIEIQNRLKREFSSWKVQEPSDLSPIAHERWGAEKPLQCPGLVIGQFVNAKAGSYAVLLVPQEYPRTKYRFLILTPRIGQPSYELKVVAQSDDTGAANVFIRGIRTSKFFDEQSRRRFQVEATDGILFVDAAENEYETDVYFWAKGAFQHEPIDY